jgi:uncharacterized protein HemY
LGSLGELNLKQTRFSVAVEFLTDSIKISRELESQEIIATSLYSLAQVSMAQGNLAQAHQYGKESLNILSNINHRKTDEVRNWLATLPSSEQ